MQDSTILQAISKKLNEHHRALDRHIKRSHKESQSFDSLVKEILEEVVSVKELPEEKPKQPTEVYNALCEWKDLWENLRNLDISFSACHEEIVRLKRDGKTSRHLDVSAVGRAWDVCKRGPLSQLIEFAKGIEYIGEPLRMEVDGSISGGERWIVDLLQDKQRIDESIRKDHPGELFDFLSIFCDRIAGGRSALSIQMDKIKRGLVL